MFCKGRMIFQLFSVNDFHMISFFDVMAFSALFDIRGRTTFYNGKRFQCTKQEKLKQ